jgi:hypothetical protein
MTTLSPGFQFSQEATANSVKRTAAPVPLGRVFNPAVDDSQEEWQSRLRGLEQWICELLIRNQQLRWALMEMKQVESMSDAKKQQQDAGYSPGDVEKRRRL